MKRYAPLVCCIIFFTYSTSRAQQVPDTIPGRLLTHSERYRFGLTSLYTQENNWNNADNRNLSIVYNGEVRYNTGTASWNKTCMFQSAIGYIRAPDTTWIKNTDRLRLYLMITKRSSAKLQRTFSLNINTQLLNSYSRKKGLPIRSASFFNPGTIMLSYGLTKTFWTDNFITVNFSTLKVATKPRLNFVDIKNEAEARSKHAYWYFDYGFNITAGINKMINPYLQWQCDFVCFANGLRKDQVNSDLRNIFIFFIWKYLMLKIESNIIYSPAVTTSLQYQNSILIGFLIDKSWKEKLK